MDGNSHSETGRFGDMRVLVSQVCPDPLQPRKYFKKSALQSLARSIKAFGQRTPIQVRLSPPDLLRATGCKYLIIDGERRWQACQLAGIETIRVSIEIAELNKREQHLLALISNHHREGHTHIEISCALQFQVDEGATVAFLAESLDKSLTWVYQYLSLQKLVPALQEVMHPETDEKQLLRFGEAVVLAALPPESQMGVYRKMIHLSTYSRLKFARKSVEEITGQKRKGRARDAKRFFEHFINRLSADMDSMLDMHEQEFGVVISRASISELNRLKEQLTECGKQMGALILSIDNALMIK